LSEEDLRGMSTSRMSRRDFLIGLAGAVVAGSAVYMTSRLIPVIPPTPAPKPVELTWFLYVGANQGVLEKQIIQDYMARNPHVKINVFQGSNVATYPKMVEAKRNNQPPIINAGYMNQPTTVQGDLDGMWLPLSMKNIPNAAETFERFRRPKDMGVPAQLAAMGITVNTRLVKDPPQSWAELFEDKYRGKLAFWKGTWYHLIMAARLNGGDENNIEPGFQAWKRAAKNIGVIFTSNAELQNLIIQNEVAVVMSYFASNTAVFANAGLPVKFIIPKEGAIAFPVYNQVVVGSSDEQKAVAEEVINILTSAETQANLAEVLLSAPMNRRAYNLLRDDIRKAIAFTPNDIDKMLNLDWIAIAKNQAEWAKRWDAEIAPLITG
jgi:putative spermidine/putrescine transport system substrate-binding protein